MALGFQGLKFKGFHGLLLYGSSSDSSEPQRIVTAPALQKQSSWRVQGLRYKLTSQRFAGGSSTQVPPCEDYGNKKAHKQTVG